MNCIYRTLLSTVALTISSVTASAETITVCASGCDYTSINAAINAASDGDVIQLAAETYFEGEQIDTDGKAITLRGVLDKAGEPASVLDGAGTHRVLICQSSETKSTSFENLLIQNGYGQIEEIAGGQYEIGGGVCNRSASSPVFVNCTFMSNWADFGGGMLNDTSSPALTNCTFTSNSADIGGGMYNYDSSSPTLSNCTFASNSADSVGGGMINSQSSPTLSNCTFTNHSADDGSSIDGSGMYNLESSPALTDCTFASNSFAAMSNVVNSSPTLTACAFATNYNGMFNSDSSPTLADCVFEGNSGRGMYNFYSSPTLTDCSFTSNSTLGPGGGMYNLNSSPTLTDCTFTGNSADYGGGGMYNKDGSNPTLTGCTFTECCQVYPPRSFIDDGGNDYDSWCDDCRADVNCRDNAVNAADLGILIGSWGTNDPQCDINGDGTVSAADLGLLIGAWGPCQ